MADSPVALEIVHAIADRVRLRPSQPLSAEALIGLADRIAGLPAARRVLARPGTGSLIVETQGPAQRLLDQIAAQGIADPRQRPAPPPVGDVARLGLVRADSAVRRATAGGLDLNAAFAVLLLAGAGLQLLRGRVAGPATTLAMAALSMLDRPSGNGG